MNYLQQGKGECSIMTSTQQTAAFLPVGYLSPDSLALKSRIPSIYALPKIDESTARRSSNILQAFLMKGPDDSYRNDSSKTTPVSTQSFEIPEIYSLNKVSFPSICSRSSRQNDVNLKQSSVSCKTVSNNGTTNGDVIIKIAAPVNSTHSDDERVRTDSVDQSSALNRKLSADESTGSFSPSNYSEIKRSVESNSDESVEETRSKFMRLSTSSFSSVSTNVQVPKSQSNPGTPPSPLSLDHHPPPRKYSMGSLDHRRVKHRRAPTKIGNPEEIEPPPNRKRSAPDVLQLETESSGDGLSSFHENNSSAHQSPPRQRAFTFTNTDRPQYYDFSSRGNLLKHIMCGGSSQDCLLQLPGRQRVTLAKRNLNPVKSRVLERLHAMVNFVRNLPEFLALPPNDQKTLLMSSAHRLLLLFMAEVNLEFAVTSVDDEEDGGKCSELVVDNDGHSPLPRRQLEIPTSQFVDGIQNFIGKCQSIGIRPSEYFFMRWIVLFHVGANKLERGDEVSSLNTAARQDLQEIISDSHPTDKLRYSRLLLALHTVFGVNCAMLESLLCAPLDLAGDLETFVYKLFCAYEQRDRAMNDADSAQS